MPNGVRCVSRRGGQHRLCHTRRHGELRPWTPASFPNSAVHTPRRIPLVRSRTASLRPLPSCRYLRRTPRWKPPRVASGLGIFSRDSSVSARSTPRTLCGTFRIPDASAKHQRPEKNTMWRASLSNASEVAFAEPSTLPSLLAPPKQSRCTTLTQTRTPVRFVLHPKAHHVQVAPRSSRTGSRSQLRRTRLRLRRTSC
jgi:hypothetical protein